MDIHPPEGPTRSLKDFAIHILIVTIGILIALSLEGIIESVHNHNLVAEARVTFHDELESDRQNLNKDLPRVKEVETQVNRLLLDLPKLIKAPDQLRKRVAALQPSFYFFTDTGWGSVLASGALTHMKTEEVKRFEEAYISLRNYQDTQKLALPLWIAVDAYYQSHTRYNLQEATEGEEKLRAFQLELQGMEHVGEEFSHDMNEALAPR